MNAKSVQLFYQRPVKADEWGLGVPVTKWAKGEVTYFLEHFSVQWIKAEVWSDVPGFMVYIWDEDKSNQLNHFCTQIIFHHK